jgi:uncharacterized repeat protein (TIGR01451 family)
VSNTCGQYGGGMSNGYELPPATAALFDVTFDQNEVVFDDDLQWYEPFPGGGGLLNGVLGIVSGKFVTFTHNTARVLPNGRLVLAQGGGAYNMMSGKTDLEQTYFEGNVADKGGGVANFAQSWDLAPPDGAPRFQSQAGAASVPSAILTRTCDVTLTNATLIDNHALMCGGGALNTVWIPELFPSTSPATDATAQGGPLGSMSANLTLITATLYQNESEYFGGGVCNGSNFTGTNVYLIDNTAGFGGGVSNINGFVLEYLFYFLFGGPPSPANSKLPQPQWGRESASGVAVAQQPPFPPAGSTTLVNTVFDGNTAEGGFFPFVSGTQPGVGGAMLNGPFGSTGETTTLTNVTFSANAAVSGTEQLPSGAIYSDSFMTMTNGIVWGHEGPEPMDVPSYGMPPTTTINFSDIQGGWISGTNNIDIDPLFVDPAGTDGISGTLDDNLRLSAGSPALDVGDNSALPPDVYDLDRDGDTSEPIPIDLGGNPRVTNSVVDMGAYELSQLIADVTVAKASEPAVILPGGTLTYTLSFSNTLTDPAVEVYISDTLPAGTVFDAVVAAPDGWSGPSLAGQTVGWYTPTLGGGASGQFVFTAIANLGAAISPDWVLTNTAEITCANDLTPTNNGAAASTIVQGLEITQVRPHGDVCAGWNFWYYIYVTNTTNMPATNLVVVDKLPPEVAPYSVLTTGGGSFDGIDTVTWTLPSLGGGFGTTLWIRARTFTSAAGKCMVNEASADSDQAAPAVSANNIACVLACESPPVDPPPPDPTPEPPSGTTVEIQNSGAGQSEDSYVYRYAPDSNYGGDSLLRVGYKQLFASMLKFNLSAVPSGATVQQATLQVYARGWGGQDIQLEAYALQKGISASQATWNVAQAGSPWDVPGAEGVPADRRGSAEDMVTTHGVSQWYHFDLTALVQDWVSGSANDGLLLKGDSSAYAVFLASSECQDVWQRPKLVVTYK